MQLMSKEVGKTLLLEKKNCPCFYTSLTKTMLAMLALAKSGALKDKYSDYQVNLTLQDSIR